ncbi:hypothetical protein LPJ66_012059, partial [Kickxella alabastrina]
RHFRLRGSCGARHDITAARPPGFAPPAQLLRRFQQRQHAAALAGLRKGRRAVQPSRGLWHARRQPVFRLVVRNGADHRSYGRNILPSCGRPLPLPQRKLSARAVTRPPAGDSQRAQRHNDGPGPGVRPNKVAARKEKGRDI